MATVDRHHFDLVLAICQPQTPEYPVHWMMMMRHPGADRCTWLHCEGSRGDRKTEIEEGKRYDSWGIDTTHFLCRILASMGIAVVQEALALPKQSCRWWVLYLMLRLEDKGLMPLGTFERWEKHRRTGSTENFGTGCLGKCSRSKCSSIKCTRSECARLKCSNPECPLFNCKNECLGETYWLILRNCSFYTHLESLWRSFVGWSFRYILQIFDSKILPSKNDHWINYSTFLITLVEPPGLCIM
jgi:hypothetical protein